MAKKILIVEDEPSLLNILRKKIEEQGYTVISAVDGSDALAKIKSRQPDLIVLDIIMPKKNGLEVLRELRVNLESKIPVIILSNLESKQDIDASKHYDAIDYVFKSDISLRDITAKVAKILSSA